MFTGSSRHRLVDGELLTIKRNSSVRIKAKSKSSIKVTNEESNEFNPKQIDTIKRSYKLNKSKVKKKCHAFSRLEKSKKFLAFYSISFPEGLSDEIGYKIFNTWLTRCRKDCNLKSYLWIAERQKNGTIHFHLLTNDFMPIRKVNGFMASCLTSEKAKGMEVLKDVNIKNYNGVDVKKVDTNRKSLIGYLTKYITKNGIEFTHLLWHCSRDVSKLFTTINFEESDKPYYFNQIPDPTGNYNIHITDKIKVAGFKFRPNDKIYSDLDGINELIYNNN